MNFKLEVIIIPVSDRGSGQEVLRESWRRLDADFGRGKTNPVAAADVAQVIAASLADLVRPRGLVSASS